ncbi:hypothetical protein JG688_00018502 [Phytophthora aleatoria]|uniref:RxLR effector protein n=1 Tax=Phytophthora aleatoria TaxID=2496075 RepID=A0A8J5MB23_9STRA|nr:hypothetical protein JG688_00018502 [Phytophthora aleatoria]
MVAGTAHGGQSKSVGQIFLRQESNGLHWTVARDPTPSTDLAEDVATLANKADQHELVFQAHPHLHKFLWAALEATSNRTIKRDLKRQPFRRYNGIIGKRVRDVADKLEATAQQDVWHHSVMRQTPKHIWRAGNALSGYQVWVVFRHATKCRGCNETYTHIFWKCDVSEHKLAGPNSPNTGHESSGRHNTSSNSR